MDKSFISPSLRSDIVRTVTSPGSPYITLFDPRDSIIHFDLDDLGPRACPEGAFESHS